MRQGAAELKQNQGVGLSLFLASLPLWLSVLLVVVLPTGAAMGASLLIRRTVTLERLADNNEVAGFKFAVLGVVYAVLLGFAVIVVWEKLRDAQNAVMQEGSSVVAISRLLSGLDPAASSAVRPRLIEYVETVIADDWPAMAQARMSPHANAALDALYGAILAPPPGAPRDPSTVSALLSALDEVTQGRRERLVLATGSVPEVLGAVLFASAIVTLCFTFFFGTRSVRAQALMTGMLAAVIFMALYVVVEIDYPFAGPIGVKPDALRLALDMIRAAH